MSGQQMQNSKVLVLMNLGKVGDVFLFGLTVLVKTVGLEILCDTQLTSPVECGPSSQRHRQSAGLGWPRPNAGSGHIHSDQSRLNLCEIAPPVGTILNRTGHIKVNNQK